MGFQSRYTRNNPYCKTEEFGDVVRSVLMILNNHGKNSQKEVFP